MTGGPLLSDTAMGRSFISSCKVGERSERLLFPFPFFLSFSFLFLFALDCAVSIKGSLEMLLK